MILPVEVLGSGANTTLLGAIKRGRFARQYSINSASLACAPGLSSMKASGVSTHLGSGWGCGSSTRL